MAEGASSWELASLGIISPLSNVGWASTQNFASEINKYLFTPVTVTSFLRRGIGSSFIRLFQSFPLLPHTSRRFKNRRHLAVSQGPMSTRPRVDALPRIAPRRCRFFQPPDVDTTRPGRELHSARAKSVTVMVAQMDCHQMFSPQDKVFKPTYAAV